MIDINTAKTAHDVVVDKIEIITPNGKVQDVSYFYDLLTIYESIYAPVNSGEIQITDGVNLYSNLALNGSEFIRIQFKKPGDEYGYSKVFRIYSCTNRQPRKENQTQVYTLNFCSEELIFSNHLLISRALKNGSATTNILSILTNDLKVGRSKIDETNFEPSLGTTHFVFTSAKPFEIIETLMKYAYSYNDSPFLFFENSQGFNFKSLQYIFSQPVIATLNYSTAKPAVDPKESAHVNTTELSTFIFDNSFDMLNTTQKSTFAGSLYTLDLVRQKYSKINHSLAQPGITSSLVDAAFPTSDFRNRNGKTVFEEYDTRIKYALTNFERTNTPFVQSKGIRETNTNIEKVLMQREMHLSLLNNSVVKCILPGNPNYTIGTIVDFNLPGFMKEDKNDRFIDPYLSGKYLVTGVKHSITRGEGFETSLELSKNSSKAQYTFANSVDYSRAAVS